MEINKENIRLPENICGGSAQIMVEGDVIVPDTKPDAARILQVNASSMLSDTEAADGRCSFRGTVRVDILYAPEEGENSVYAMHTDMEFEHRIDDAKLKGGCPIIAVSDARRIEFQILNSRKIRIKAVVSLEYSQTAEREVSFPADIEGEKIKRTMRMRSSAGEVSREFSAKETVEVPAGRPSVKDILTVMASSVEKTYKIVSGKVVIRGNVAVSVLYTGTDNAVRFMDADIPFTEVVEVEGITEDSQCEIECRAAEIRYEVGEDSDGDMRLVQFDTLMQLWLRATRETEVEFVEDCYLIGKGINLEREEVVIEDSVAAKRYKSTLRETSAPGRGDPQISAVYGVKAFPSVSSAAAENDRVIVEGKVEIYVLYITDSESVPVYSLKKDVPFSCAIDCPGAKRGMDASVRVEVEHISYSINGAGEVELRCIIAIDARAVKKNTVSLITAAEECEIDKEDKKGIVIYFVQPGDSLWGIAKRYRVSQEGISALNGLEEEELKPGRQIMIPAV